MSEVEISGAFAASLKRNNKQIRDDRATAIVEATELLYKRTIEDLEIALKRLKREQDNMLDLSPSDSNSLKLATDFDETEYVKTDIEIGLKIRNIDIKLDVAKRRYEYLFGGN